MPLTRSRENLLNLGEPSNVSFTVNLDDHADQTGPHANTRSGRSRTMMGNPPGGDENNETQIRQIVNESLNVFRGEITSLITNELRSAVQNMNFPIDNNNANSNVSPRSNDNSGNSVDSGYLNAERVLNIIRNWRLKFNGYGNQASVDEFIYRVNILTSNTLNGDFELLCKHAHTLFDDKALAWYWRFHRQNDHFDWNRLTQALRIQYKSVYSDYEVLDDVRRRKQRFGESFDDYYDVMSAMTDKLNTPLADVDLCEILLRNLRPEIRHEILHVDIGSVAELRREVRKHEKFMRDVQIADQRKTTKGKISVLDGCDSDSSALDANFDNEVLAVQHSVKCWNCDQIGHTFFDCMDTKRVFCYGCGLKDTYKPKCPNCSIKAQGNGLMGVRRR